MKKRFEFIDLTKLLAILFIITSHTNVLPEKLNIFFNSFYIAVFFVCTGYTFNEEKVNDLKNLSNQIFKLIKYYLFYSIVLLIIYSSFSYVKGTFAISGFYNNFIGIFYCRYTYYIGCKDILMGIGNAPMWFIGCYILSYCLFFMLMKYLKKYSIISILFMVIIGYVFSLVKILLPCSLDVVPYTVIFIYIGYYVKKYNLISKINFPFIIICILILVFMTISNTSINLSLKNYGINYFYTLVMGIIGSISLISFSNYLCYFNIFKKYSRYGSYTIDMMCYHLLIIFLFSFVFHNCFLVIFVDALVVVVSKPINMIVKMILKIK